MKQTLRVPGEEGCWLHEVDAAVWRLRRAAVCSPWKLSSVDLQTNISTP